MNEPTIYLTLELQQRDDSLTGQIVGVHGKAAFNGWLGLICALDAVVRAHADGDLANDMTALQGGTR